MIKKHSLSKDRLSNLTSSLDDLHSSGSIDGVEIDWEWPTANGDKKDRSKLVKYARVGWNNMIKTR